MKASRFVILGVIAVGLLLAADVGVRVRQWRNDKQRRAITDVFEVVYVRTNEMKGLALKLRRTGDPIWIAWNFYPTNKLDLVSYYWAGNNVMNFYPRPNAPPRFDVSFFGEDGVMQSLWFNRGTNPWFTERTQYGTDTPRKEIWFDEQWHFVEFQTNAGKRRAGIVLDGKWHHVVFTNEDFLIDPPEAP
jgi:hypothetical protein